MRTTLDLDSDVLEAAKEMAARTKKTAGQILSELARTALVSDGARPEGHSPSVNGFEIIPASDRVVTSQLVQKLMEESERP